MMYWYVLRAPGGHEIKTARLLEEVDIATYVPEYRVPTAGGLTMRPMFTSYVFTHQDHPVACVRGVYLRYLCNQGKACVIPDSVIVGVRSIENELRMWVAPERPVLKKSNLVIVISGPFIGRKGRVIEGGTRVKVKLLDCGFLMVAKPCELGLIL